MPIYKPSFFISALRLTELQSMPNDNEMLPMWGTDNLSTYVTLRHNRELYAFSRRNFTERHGGKSGGIYDYNIDKNKWGEKRIQRSSDTLTIDYMFVCHAWVNLNMLWLLCGKEYKEDEHYSLFCVNLVSLEWYQVNMRAYDDRELPKVSKYSSFWPFKFPSHSLH